MTKVSDLTVGYGQSEILQKISFEAKSEEILAIMGRNGMGKTTLLKSLIGILPARAGKIELDGVDLTPMASYQRVAAGFAFVPQGRMIFSNLTVFENMMTGARGEVLPSTLDEIYALFPVLFEMKGRKGGNLSGGQQQQLAIARALLTNPKVLILDEPTEGIQPSIIKDIARALREILKIRKLTIIVSEQVLSFVMEACDRILVMERGQFVHEVDRANVDPEKIKKILSV